MSTVDAIADAGLKAHLMKIADRANPAQLRKACKDLEAAIRADGEKEDVAEKTNGPDQKAGITEKTKADEVTKEVVEVKADAKPKAAKPTTSTAAGAKKRGGDATAPSTTTTTTTSGAGAPVSKRAKTTDYTDAEMDALKQAIKDNITDWPGFLSTHSSTFHATRTASGLKEKARRMALPAK